MMKLLTSTISLKTIGRVAAVTLAFSTSYLFVSTAETNAKLQPTPVGLINPSDPNAIILVMPKVVTQDSLKELYTAAIFGKSGQHYIILDDTNGGEVDAIVKLVELIKGSDARFTIHISKLAASAGAYLACNVGGVTLSGKNPQFMVHRASGDLGPGNANIALATALELVRLDNMLWASCKPFMTAKQWKDFQEGKNVFIPATQLLDGTTHIRSQMSTINGKGK